MPSNWQGMSVSGQIPADLIIPAGSGQTLLANTDLTQPVWLSDDPGLIPGQQFSIPLNPQSTIVLDGKTDIYVISNPGHTVVVNVMPGAMSFFQSTILGTNFIITKAGFFVYSGTPGVGNLIASIVAPGTTHDPYGNSVAAVLEAGSLGTNYTQVDSAGRINLFAAGTKEVIIDPSTSSIFVYQGGAALGNLIASITAVANNDPFGQPVLQGITSYNIVGAISGQAVQLNSGIISWFFSTGQGQPWSASANIGSDSGGDLTLGPLANKRVLISNGNTNTALVEIDNSTSMGTELILATLGASASNRWMTGKVSGDGFARLGIDTDASGNPQFQLGPGNASVDVSFGRYAAHKLSVLTADLDIGSVGRGLQIAEGSNARMGTAVLAAGTVTVANTSVTANTRIFLTGQSALNAGELSISVRTAGTSFTIVSSNAADTRTVAYLLIEPG